MCITKSKISMHTCRSRMSDTLQGAFVVIPEISHSDISCIIKRKGRGAASEWGCSLFQKLKERRNTLEA